ncbi:MULTISPECIES: hypothetical protein [unclassified Bacillus (in: firmicutes)]|uniref:hypothetical protein n=1 Tax=unclassified Bacillus (in: firmicutes) TaxID=185979 RepID=UPI0008E73E33|nr:MULTISPECIES: hypothetical protein [unclassified Bacillus (in: firmicutes)]SFB16234.1 stage II sporulation protein B [Bacillus sp. UNCCL13]SFQ78203.1 stage II sporulation protein B [Bacillus sp. cl95]
MDKRQNGKTITIKINGNEQPFREDTSSETILPLETFTRNETAAAQEAAEESFDWILPENDNQNEIAEYRIVNQPAKKTKNKTNIPKQIWGKNNNTHIKSIVFSVFFALLFGTSLGVLMLKLVINDQTEPAKTAATTPVTGGSDTPKETVGKSAFLLHPISTFIVQEGVYSTKDGAEKASEAAKQKGVPTAIIEKDGKFLLILGIAGSIDHAKSLGATYKEKDIDFFAKALEIPERPLADVNASEKEVMETAASFYQSLTVAASYTASDMPAELTAKLDEYEKEWTSLKDDKGNAKVKGMKEELLGASAAAKTFSKSKKESDYQKLQQHLLSFVVLYHS